MRKIAKYVLLDLLRNRFLIVYGWLLGMVSLCLFYFQGDVIRSLNSMVSIVMFVVPLVSIVFTTTHLYNSSEFIELMVSQPVKRSTIVLAEFLGTSVAMSAATLLGTGIPVVLYSADNAGLILVGAAVSIAMVFTSLALFAAMVTRDKAKGIGLSLLIWLGFTVIYDGLLLALMFSFGNYPIEKPVMVLTALNPVDLGRIMVLLKLDVSALLGYTGALYRDFFGSSLGIGVVMMMLLAWIVFPVVIAVRVFRKRNL